MAQGQIDNVHVLVGQRLRALRLEHDMTQAQVAKIIDISPQQYQKYEDASTKCSLNAIVALAAFYGVSVSWIVSPTEAAAEASTQVVAAESDTGALNALATGDEDLLSRLVSAYLRLPDQMEKLRVVELLETIKAGHF